MIISRKITKFVTRAQIAKSEEIDEAARDFVAEVKTEMVNVGARNTYYQSQRYCPTKGASRAAI